MTIKINIDTLNNSTSIMKFCSILYMYYLAPEKPDFLSNFLETRFQDGQCNLLKLGRRPGEEAWGGGLGRRPGEEAWGGGLGRRPGGEAWGGGLGRRPGEEAWGGGLGRRPGEEAWGGGLGTKLVRNT